MPQKLKKHKLKISVKGKKIKKEDLLPESRGFLFENEGKEELTREADPIGRGPKTEAMEERYKRMVMWSGVGFFMLLIVIAWTYNMKSVFKSTEVKANNGQPSLDINEMTKEFQKAITEMKTGVEEIKDLKAGLEKDAEPNVLPKGDDTGAVLDAKALEELKKNLEVNTNVIKPETK